MYLAVILNREGVIVNMQSFIREPAAEAWLDHEGGKMGGDVYGRVFRAADIVQETKKFKAIAI